MGADVATSIHLRDHSYLWLWGDTLVGRLSGTGRDVQEFPRNSISILNLDDPAGQTFCTCLATDLPHHHSLDTITVYKSGNNAGFFSTGNPDTWLWPMHGVVSQNTAYLNAPIFRQASPGAFTITTHEPSTRLTRSDRRQQCQRLVTRILT